MTSPRLGACHGYRGMERVVVGENRTFLGAEDLLREHGVELVVADDPACVEMM